VGNGQIDLSGRGNLQLRGLADRHLDALRDAIGEAGLLDPSAEGEAVRNVVSSPLAGLDPVPCSMYGGYPRARATPFARFCPARAAGKFGFVIDDGGALGLETWPLIFDSKRVPAGTVPIHNRSRRGITGAYKALAGSTTG